MFLNFRLTILFSIVRCTVFVCSFAVLLCQNVRRHGTLAHIFANLTTAVMCGQREDNHTFPHMHYIYVMMAEGLLRGIATGVKDREKRTKGKRG